MHQGTDDLRRGIFDVRWGTEDVHSSTADVQEGTDEVEEGTFEAQIHPGSGALFFSSSTRSYTRRNWIGRGPRPSRPMRTKRRRPS
jgi:hypothetical protein